MKKVMKLMLTLVLTLAMSFSMITTVSANDTEDEIISDLIAYYTNYQDKAVTDIERLVADLKEIDPVKGEAWEKIMNYWIYVNRDMVVNKDVAPDGLVNDDSLCFVVLGFQLNPDGTMKDELIGRLTVALESAKKYPNAYVACTGGGTASENPSATEADQMAAWLIEQGVDANRIIIENKSKSTVENAKFTYAILRKDFPQIKTLAMITSDYHVPRGSLLYNSQLLLSAYLANDQLLTITSNAGYTTGSQGYESIQLQAYGVCQIAGIQAPTEVPELAVLDNLVYEGKTEYTKGEALEVKVTAQYDNGYTKDVSNLVSVEGYDADKSGEQIITITYSENEVVKVVEVKVNVAEITKPVTPPVDNTTNKDEDKTSVATGDNFELSNWLGLAVLSLGLLVGLRKEEYSK